MIACVFEAHGECARASADTCENVYPHAGILANDGLLCRAVDEASRFVLEHNGEKSRGEKFLAVRRARVADVVAASIHGRNMWDRVVCVCESRRVHVIRSCWRV